MDPPQCVQNAMMTKDKKPFTYTPGGIDLSEVKSPRMQRRIERNANLGGVSDVPKPPPPQNVGPLPPSALAVMRPQTQVQVFPGPPPPPPTQKNIPPPPPPPSCPLPTQKVTTGTNEVLERPDMTKIIPENPMARLRKTGGPSPRKSLVDQMYEEHNQAPPPPQRNFEAQSPRYQQPPVVAPVSPPAQQQRQTQSYQSPPQQYQSPSSPQNQYQPTPKVQYQPQPQPQYQPAQQRSVESPKPSAYSPPIIERPVQRQEPPQKNVSSSVGSLYIPPLNQQQQKVASPSTSPERSQPQVQSPGTSTLKEAPRPWQQRNVQQQQEVPAWARKDESEPQSVQSSNMQQVRHPQGPQPQQAPPSQPVRPQPPNQQFSPRPVQAQTPSPRPIPTQNQTYQPSNTFPVHIEIRTGPGSYYQQEPEPSERKPNAVYVTQPIILQHPGPGIEPPYKGGPPNPQSQPQQYQQPRQQVTQAPPKVDASGARIIPIQIERTPPSTPGGDRNLNRQLSWGSQPSQSNSFKVIQKITKTDEDEVDDIPVTQHSARYTQEMPEQMRRMKVNDNNGNFRQGNGQPQPYVHPSEQVVQEPKKYMGSNIPSRSFKILQAMTAPSDNCANANNNEEMPFIPFYNPYGYPYYPSPYWSEYYTNYYPQEQSEQSRNSEKTKNGRSTPLLYSQPHWNEFYQNNYPQEQSDSTSKMSDRSSKACTQSGRSTPLLQPYWHEYYPSNYPQEQSDSTSKMSDRSSKGSTKSGRSTPLPNVPLQSPMPPPFWGFMPAPPHFTRPRPTSPKSENILRPQTPKFSQEYQNQEGSYHYPIYTPYFDPYYYNYYYGYPPMMPPHPYYQSSTENEEHSGYSSMDEMLNFNNSRRSSLKRRNSFDNGPNSVQALKQHFEVRSKSAAPRITITPTFSQEDISFNVPPDKDKDESEEDSDTEVEENENNSSDQDNQICRLRSIKSVPNVNVYTQNTDFFEESETTESEDTSDEEADEGEICAVVSEEEIIPHQLSVIYEESERADSRRCISVASEATTINEHLSEEEQDDEDLLANQNVKFKINLFQEASEKFSKNTVGGSTVKTYQEQHESFASVKSCGVRDRHERHFEGKSMHTLEEHTDSLCNTSFNGDKTINFFEKECDVFAYKFNKKADTERNKRTYFNQNNNRVNIEEVQSDDNNFVCSQLEDQVHKNFEKNSDEKIGKMENDFEKESEDDWWGVIKKQEVNLEKTGDSSFKKACNSMKSETKLLNDKDEDEVICVILRNKNEVKENTRTKANKPEKESFFSKTSTQRDSVYDELKTNEDIDNEIVSGGTLMRVDSFASQLEALKKNSGFWNLADSILSKPNCVIKEESPDKEESNIKKDKTECVLHTAQFKNGEDTEKNVEYQENHKHVAENVTSETGPIKVEPVSEEISNHSQSSEEIDFWSQIKNDDDDFIPKRRSFYQEKEEDDAEEETVDYAQNKNTQNVEDYCETDHSDSANSRNSSYRKSHKDEEKVLVNDGRNNEINYGNKYYNKSSDLANKNIGKKEHESVGSESSDEEQELHKVAIQEPERSSNSRSKSLEPQTIKERIEALRNSIANKQRQLSDREEINISVRGKISAIEVPSESRSKTASTKSSMKSFEEYSEEEELDSGVISDISRHISDNEDFPELKKLTRYERAATHSRLFKLLQDQCDIEDNEKENEVFEKTEDKFSKLSVRNRCENINLSQSKSKLSLPLNQCNKDNENKPILQVNEKLVEELVQSLLRSKKAQILKNMPKEKLYAAAITILQEGIDSGETPSEEFSSLLSPLRGDTESSTPAQTPQEFYGDYTEYKQYYDSWSDAAVEVTPSKAFKLLQEHLESNKVGRVDGFLARCPKILSSKNIPREILKLIDETSDCSRPSSRTTPPHSNDITNT